MKKTSILIGILVGLMFSLLLAPAHADVEWTIKKDLPLGAKPLDMASSVDGRWIFILVPREVIIYSPSEDKVINRIPVEKGFDKLIYSSKDDMLILSNSRQKMLRMIQIEKVYEISVSGLPYRGPETAPVTIIVFTDYQCPYCARLEPLLQQMLEKYPDKVKLVFKNFPLAMHKSARNAAAAALAANVQGKFWEYGEMLFQNYRGLDDAKIQAIAKGLNLNMEQFNSDMKSPAIRERINQDIKNGQAAEVRGTPTVFINGKLLKNKSLNGFTEKIETELEKKE